MREAGQRIAYTYEETPSGGRVRLVAGDATAIAGIHEFLRFQIEDHRTGDAETIAD